MSAPVVPIPAALPAPRWQRYPAIWLAQMRYSITREMMFKGNFILWIIVDLLWFVLQLAFIDVLYFRVESIAGWSQWEMIMLVATSQVIQQFFIAFLMLNLSQLQDDIRTGKLDFYLAQPAHPQFLVSTRKFDLGSVVNALFGVGLCVYAAWHLPGALTVTGVGAYVVLVIAGIMIHYSIVLALMSLCFWITQAQGFMMAYYNIFQMARIPREAFRGVILFLFTYIFPLLLVSNVPARTLMGTEHLGFIGYMMLFAVVLMIVSSMIFNRGLKRYGSASS